MVTQQGLEDWTSASPRDWDQLCQALMWNYCDQFGRIVSTPPSAIDAYYASNIVSYDAYTAPPGSFIYLDIGEYGHVALAVDSSDAMATSHLQEEWGINAGLSALAHYVSVTGATPLGWSWDNAGNTITYTSTGGGGGSNQEADVAKYTRFQNNQDMAVRPQWQRFPYKNNPRAENIAAGTGGLGLYSVNLNLYLKEFYADAQVEGRLVLAPSGGSESPGYLFTVDGNESGIVKVAVPAIMNITKSASLYFELHKTKGAKDPILDTWGADVTNFSVK